MTSTRAAGYGSVTDVIVQRDKLDVELPLALFLSFIGHFALLVFLSVFQGFTWLRGHSEAINLGAGGGEPMIVEALPDIGLPPPAVPEMPEVDVPAAPEPEVVEFEEPAIEIPDVDSEVEFAPPKPPEPPKEEKKPEPKPAAKPTAKATAVAMSAPKPAPAKPATKGSLSIGSPGSGEPGAGGFGGTGVPDDPGLAFWAQRASTLIAEFWRQPYVNVPQGTVLECVIFFAVSRDGTVSDVAVERTSGIPNMDQNALRAVIDTAQLPALPPTYRGDEITVSFTFRYQAGQ